MANGNAARICLLASIVATFPAVAAEDTDLQLQRIMKRMENLEKRNDELEKALQARRGTSENNQVEERLKKLENYNTKIK